METKNTLIKFGDSLLLSYAQIFFSNQKIFGALLLLVSFFDFWSGFMGVFSVVVSLFIARQLGFDKTKTETGVFSYNSLLTGLGIGLYFEPSFSLFIFAFFISLLVLLLSATLWQFFANYGLPFLSIPFLLGIWMVDFSSSSFTYLGLSDRSIYHYNHLYEIGGSSLIGLYNFVSAIPVLYSLDIYFLSLGAIFFQYQVVAGILIAIGLLFHSRIGFILSLIGFYSAWGFYSIMGASLEELSYSYIGFNFILTAIAIGGFYLIPNRFSMLWMLLILPLVVLITIASMKLFSLWGLGIYALPFNATVILFLYMNKIRLKNKYHLKQVYVQHYSPEKNLYFDQLAEKRFAELKYLPIQLPISGIWTISQAHNGEYTHKEDWKHAWDFVILNASGSQYQGDGFALNDYLCYNKNVLAAYDGIVQEVVRNIHDNPVGENNLLSNWGNTIVIKHSEYLFSKYSHLQKDSISLKKGDWVKKGQVIAKVGNSGRSPYPHLHFQLQQTPYIGSHTILYPISSFFTIDEQGKRSLKTYDFPKTGEKIEKIGINELMNKAMTWEVGREIEIEIEENGIKRLELWRIQADMYRNTYIESVDTNSFAYFYNDGNLTYFKNFVGKKSTALYHFYLALYKVHHSFYAGVKIDDEVALHITSINWGTRIAQDFLAPFYIYLHTKYTLVYQKTDDDFSPNVLTLESSVSNYQFGKLKKQSIYQIEIHSTGLIDISLNHNNLHISQKN